MNVYSTSDIYNMFHMSVCICLCIFFWWFFHFKNFFNAFSYLWLRPYNITINYKVKNSVGWCLIWHTILTQYRCVSISLDLIGLYFSTMHSMFCVLFLKFQLNWLGCLVYVVLEAFSVFKIFNFSREFFKSTKMEIQYVFLYHKPCQQYFVLSNSHIITRCTN